MSTIKTQISVKSSGDGVEEESEWKPTLLTNTVGAAVGAYKQLLATGGNDLSVPTGSMNMVIMPPAASTAVLKLKGGAGETGFALRSGYPSAIPLPTGTANVHIDSSIRELVYIHWG